MGKCFSKPKFEEELGPDGLPIISLRNFELMRSVGKGAFGKVRIVQHKKTKDLYAMKYINKEKCISQNAVKNTILERNLLEAIEHPLIVNLRYAFQDDENMFMVLDLMLGGDLKFLLRKSGRMPEEWVKFYVAEMIVALDYCHKQGIVHRDIKPDNLLLDDKGHVHLTDFNVATYLPSDSSLLTSFSGTVSYMSPEVIRKSGYREECDWWSVAVVAFELLFGKKPFRAASSREVMSRITHSEFIFPSTSMREISEECLDFISACFERDITKRLGYGPNGVKGLMDHPFFTGIVWSDIEKKELHPPFTPNLKTGNFSAIYEAEDILLEDNPLKTSNKRKSTVPSEALATDPKQLKILNEFKDYDFNRPISRGEKDQKLKLLQENSKQLEESRSKFNNDTEEIADRQHDEESNEGMGEEIDESK